jgi:hypothetical protein
VAVPTHRLFFRSFGQSLEIPMLKTELVLRDEGFKIARLFRHVATVQSAS